MSFFITLTQIAINILQKLSFHQSIIFVKYLITFSQLIIHPHLTQHNFMYVKSSNCYKFPLFLYQFFVDKNNHKLLHVFFNFSGTSHCTHPPPTRVSILTHQFMRSLLPLFLLRLLILGQVFSSIIADLWPTKSACFSLLLIDSWESIKVSNSLSGHQ